LNNIQEFDLVLGGGFVSGSFVGTGTSLLAAMSSGRNSIGYEIEKSFAPIIQNTLTSDASLEIINNAVRTW